VLVPTLRAEYSLTLNQVGLLLAAGWVGALATLLLWGLAADRVGERAVLVVGLGGCALCLAAAAYASDFAVLLGLLALAGASGASVNSASGRAVMQWFGASERGLALGIRQTAIPIGGLVAALVLPALAAAGGSEAAFLFVAALCAGGAVAGALVLRAGERVEVPELEPATVSRTLRDGRLWRLCFGSGLFVYAQVAVIGYGVLFLHDEHGLSDEAAALVIAAAQVLAVALRIAAGRWSDVIGARIRPLRLLGAAIAVGVGITAALAGGPLWLLIPCLALAGGLSMAWNGLAFTAAAELAGARRSGAAIGFQQTMLGALGVAAPVVFAYVVSGISWRASFALAALFPLAGALALRPLAIRESARGA
jgi:sugar phosphate permease